MVDDTQVQLAELQRKVQQLQSGRVSSEPVSTPYGRLLVGALGAFFFTAVGMLFAAALLIYTQTGHHIFQRLVYDSTGSVMEPIADPLHHWDGNSSILDAYYLSKTDVELDYLSKTAVRRDYMLRSVVMAKYVERAAVEKVLGEIQASINKEQVRQQKEQERQQALGFFQMLLGAL